MPLPNATDRCDFRTERECSCGPNECRVQNIGTVRRTNDMSGVFTVPASQQIIRLLLVGTIIGIGFATVEFADRHRAMELAEQESSR